MSHYVLIKIEFVLSHEILFDYSGAFLCIIDCSLQDILKISQKSFRHF